MLVDTLYGVASIFRRLLTATFSFCRCGDFIIVFGSSTRLFISSCALWSRASRTSYASWVCLVLERDCENFEGDREREKESADDLNGDF